MTNHYWERSASSLTKFMKLPWLSGRVEVPSHPPRLCHHANHDDDSSDDDDVLQAFQALLESNRSLRRRLCDNDE